MLRKFGAMLAVLSIPCMAAIASPGTGADAPVAETANLEVVTQYSHHYYVYYWCHNGWQTYGCYSCPLATQSAVSYLQRLGYQTRVTCEYGA